MSIPRPMGPPGAWFEQLGVTGEVLRQALAAALSRGGDDCDLFFQHTASTSVQLSDHKVDRASTEVDLGVGVRVVEGDRHGYAYSEDLSLPAILRAAHAAAAIAHGQGRPAAAAVAGARPRDLYPVREPWTEVDIDERARLVRAWEAAAFAADRRVERVEAWLSDAASVVMIVRPDGRLVEDWRPMTLAMLRCTAAEGAVRESGVANVAGRAGRELFDAATQERLVREAVDRTLFALKATPPPAGEMPVVLARGPSAILLHEAIGHGMEADFNRKRTSIYCERMGQRIAHPDVTIVDDGTVPNNRGALNVDDEGNATGRTVLVEGGVLRTYMHDEISARHYGVPPTGSARRQDFRHPPLPRMRATMMLDGPHDPQEIIASVKRGLYCETFPNGQVRIGAGDFSFFMRQGWLIEDGRLTRPVKDANIIGNGPKALELVDMVGNDMVLDQGGWTCGKDGQRVPVSQGMPTVRVQSLVVGGVG